MLNNSWSRADGFKIGLKLFATNVCLYPTISKRKSTSEAKVDLAKYRNIALNDSITIIKHIRFECLLMPQIRNFKWNELHVYWLDIRIYVKLDGILKNYDEIYFEKKIVIWYNRN